MLFRHTFGALPPSERQGCQYQGGQRGPRARRWDRGARARPRVLMIEIKKIIILVIWSTFRPVHPGETLFIWCVPAAVSARQSHRDASLRGSTEKYIFY
jgi:hypothetical protein